MVSKCQKSWLLALVGSQEVEWLASAKDHSPGWVTGGGMVSECHKSRLPVLVGSQEVEWLVSAINHGL
jgi:hypothetical protein